MTKWKHVFRDVCKCIKNQKLKSLVYISIQTLCCHTPNVELIGHSLERHTPMYIRAHNSHCMSDWNQAMQSKELSVDLHDEIVVSHLSGPGYKTISKVLSAGRSTVALKIVSGEQPALLIAWGWLLWGASQQQRPGDWGEWWMLPNTERSLKNTCSRAQVTSDGGLRFTFQHDNYLRHTAKTTLEWPGDKSLTERIFQKEWYKLLKSRCAKLETKKLYLLPKELLQCTDFKINLQKCPKTCFHFVTHLVSGKKWADCADSTQ